MIHITVFESEQALNGARRYKRKWAHEHLSRITAGQRSRNLPILVDGQRFGLHNLRHSLSNWLVNKAKEEPKTVQGLLRHSKIQTTLDLYTQEDGDETRAAQGQFLKAIGMPSGAVQ